MLPLLPLLIILLLTVPLPAQETSGSVGGGYGYTSVHYNSPSNVVTVYAETELDDDAYHSPAVDTAVSANEGYLFTSGSSSSPCPGGTAASHGSDSNIVSVTCTITNAKANDTYTATSTHSAVTYVTDYQEGINDQKNYDIDGYNSFASLDLSTPFGESYDPPYLLQHTSTKSLSLGKTVSSDSTGPRSSCNDIRDQIIAEYLSPTQPTTFTMISCSDFVAASAYSDPGAFTFLNLAPTQSTGYNQFAVIQQYMAISLRNVFNEIGTSPTINSGYRNPVKEASVGTYVPSSRHMAGDAVDLATSNSQNTYTQQRVVGSRYGGCVEPVDAVHGPQKAYDHTHIGLANLSNRERSHSFLWSKFLSAQMVVNRLLCSLLVLAGLSPAANFDDPLKMSKAPTWQVRQKALHAVLQKYDLSDPELRTGIVQLFNRETNDPKWEEEAEFDDFNQYYEKLSQLCQHIAETYRQQGAWRSLVFSIYNPGSQFAKWLISQPETLPLFLEMSKSLNNPGLAGQGLEMLGRMLQFCQGLSTPQCLQVARQRSDILTVIRQKAVSGSDDAGNAIEALGKSGDVADIQLLESRASALQNKVVNPGDEKGINNQQALLWLIRNANEEIRQRLSPPQKK